MNKTLNFGIEEEYLITDLATRTMLSQPTKQLIAECQTALGSHFAFEMFQGQIEVASPVFADLSQANEYLTNARGRLVRILENHDLGLLCAGSHPLADWRLQQATDQEHFHKLFRDFQRVAQRSVLCGLHVHVEVPDQLDRICVMNQVLPWLPLLLALSSSSPFWDGGPSGFMSYRQVACDEWPRMGVPEYFENERAYRDYLQLLLQTGSISTPSECWWGLRPAARYPTLELRMTDACPRLSDALCIASLFRIMVGHAIATPQPGAGYSHTSQWILKENRWRAKRFGIHGHFIREGSLMMLSAGHWLDWAQETFLATAEQLGETRVFDQARQIIEKGSSADRQLHCFDQAQAAGLSTPAALARVVDQLLLRG
ncbi:carboxylate-amine ligase [Pseudomonas fluorescens]|uniref:Putative glutamate--cysteine ligase 2 n=1 Tax=Pseudomonas fluorescens TaxID=294 RepID=A0A5E7AMR9_PSEFL|nr:carboxylate-amine ligase [Pseudomonas fluorescens]VVN80842.1 Glutamate--cysteine ligase [Pseudomonas fluorescens]